MITSTYCRYYGYLTVLSRRFPFRTSEQPSGTLPTPIGIKFTWEDTHASGFFGGKRIIGMFDFCIMLIIAQLLPAKRE